MIDINRGRPRSVQCIMRDALWFMTPKSNGMIWLKANLWNNELWTSVDGMASSWFNNKSRSMGTACPITRNNEFIRWGMFKVIFVGFNDRTGKWNEYNQLLKIRLTVLTLTSITAWFFIKSFPISFLISDNVCTESYTPISLQSI